MQLTMEEGYQFGIGFSIAAATVWLALNWVAKFGLWLDRRLKRRRERRRAG